VLLHEGHKLYVTCDVDSIGSLDPTANCGFRVLNTYQCVPGENRMDAPGPYSDLKCNDGAGHNVYLYVSKKE
jgi:hypothetical protein